jgi:hypothetical protein
VIQTRIVIVLRMDKSEISGFRSADACASGAQHESSATGTSGSSTGGSGNASAVAPPTSGKATHTSRLARGVLGTRFTNEALDAVRRIPLYLYVLLGLAIALLTVAAVPIEAVPNRRIAAALAHRRGAIALAGTAALIWVTISYVLS